MAAPIYRDSRAKFFSRTNYKHDFGPYPFDRELFYEITKIVVRLLEAQIPVLRPKYLEAGIWAFGLEFGP